MWFRKQFRCPECGGSEGHLSRPKTFIEKYALPVVLLRPARCAACLRRSYCGSWIPLPKRDQVTGAHHVAA